MKYDIVHKGVVAEKIGNTIIVSIIPESACGSCHAKAFCSMGDNGERLISVYEQDSEKYNIDDEVMVGMGSVMGMKAVFWSYMMPFLLMLLSLFVTRELGATELASGLITLGVAAAYLFGLYFFRKKLEKEIVFQITKI